MARTAQHRRDVASFYDLARIHDVYELRIARDKPKVVRNQQQRRLPLVGNSHDKVKHVALRRHVERSRRLVGDEQVRRLRKRHRYHHALLLSAGQLARIPAHRSGRKPNRLKQPLHRIGAILPACRIFITPHALLNLSAYAQDGIEALHRILEHVGDARRTDDAAAYLRTLNKTTYCKRSQRLAAAGFADKRDTPVLRDVEGHVADRHGHPTLHAEGDPQIPDLEQRAFHSAGAPHPIS